jgi:allophanate hydrolase-like protein
MFLNGTAMSGQKDHSAHNGSTFLGPARTAARYRFFSVRDEFPGLYPVPQAGRVIEGELYDIPEAVLRGHLLPSEPPELMLGHIELIDGEMVHAMLLVPSRLAPGERLVDISELGGFRAYLRFLSANAAIATTLVADPAP